MLFPANSINHTYEATFACSIQICNGNSTDTRFLREREKICHATSHTICHAKWNTPHTMPLDTHHMLCQMPQSTCHTPHASNATHHMTSHIPVSHAAPHAIPMPRTTCCATCHTLHASHIHSTCHLPHTICHAKCHTSHAMSNVSHHMLCYMPFHMPHFTSNATYHMPYHTTCHAKYHTQHGMCHTPSAMPHATHHMSCH